MGERIRNILRGQIVTSVIYILLGLCLVCMPVGTVNLICKLVFGIIMVVAGLYHILIYVMEKMNATVLDLFSGGILLVVGGFLFFNPQVVIKLLPILLGAFVLVDSIWTLQGAFRLKKRENAMWKVLLVGSLVFIGLGIALIVNPFQVVRYTIMFAGITLLCNGILDVAFMIILRRGLRELEKAVEEAEEEAVVEVQEPESKRDVTSKESWSFFKDLGKEEKEKPKADTEAPVPEQEAAPKEEVSLKEESFLKEEPSLKEETFLKEEVSPKDEMLPNETEEV